MVLLKHLILQVIHNGKTKQELLQKKYTILNSLLSMWDETLAQINLVSKVIQSPDMDLSIALK